ncbi:MAG: chromosomal replication initiator protein DnaA [Mariprofundaceae bacterium]|nr:chromosomal replication initiator protein DnaA [Mariprofundaceae bacterium]
MVDQDWKQRWKSIVEQIKSDIPPSKFDAWIMPIHPEFSDNCLILKVPSRIFLDGLKADCEKKIIASVKSVFSPDVAVRFEVDSSLTLPTESRPERKGKKPNYVDGYIDPRFTFDNFVVGSSNEFCYAASRAVADKPGESYNPLYIHGGVGLGKTHLINAVANELIRKNHIKIAYRTGERFTNELITAIRNNATHQFREQYRKVDVLIIDDVQFIAGKTSTQEEFFHTFNALHEVHKQIILVSDRSPREMSHLEERLRSRFNWGLVADIQPPNLETRLAILASKAELAGVTLDRDVAYLLASRITNNVRELEGALTRITAYAKLTDKVITMEVTRHVLRDQLQEDIRTISVDDIQKGVANYYNIRIQDMLSKKRTRTIAFPRQIAMYASKELTSHSLPEIGEKFGGKDHTTILYAYRKIQQMRNEDKDFDDEMKRLLSLFKS